ncbi:hypothetical protein FACS189446_2000 [Bacteroidia bacterium]|nr:hypothetical protein FACS189446_2000 [Bacteroidia bacterium]
MIITEECACVLVGEQFFPNFIIIPREITIIQKNDPGDLITFGRWKDTLANQGELIISGNIEDILIFIEYIKKSDFYVFITEINISITYCYQDQCNFEISHEHLRRFSTLGVSLGITCFENKNNE